jgi:hypothetical protein
VKKMVDPCQRPQHSELFDQDPLDVFAPEAADFILRGGPRFNSLANLGFLFRSQGTARRASPPIGQASDSFFVVTANPTLTNSPRET